jgi:hypothetical protein
LESKNPIKIDGQNHHTEDKKGRPKRGQKTPISPQEPKNPITHLKPSFNTSQNINFKNPHIKIDLLHRGQNPLMNL